LYSNAAIGFAFNVIEDMPCFRVHVESGDIDIREQCIFHEEQSRVTFETRFDDLSFENVDM
jgi:hypothetical protein